VPGLADPVALVGLEVDMPELTTMLTETARRITALLSV
jgi:hypothetical protein